MKQLMVLRGIVVSGKGEGELYVNLYAREFEKGLGFRPYPGTLNLRLDEGEARRRAEILASMKPLVIHPPEGFPGLVEVYCYPAKLYGAAVYIVEPQVPGYDKRIVELIAPMYLRKAFSLRDGDSVEVSLETPG